MDPTLVIIVMFVVVTTAVLSGYYVFTNESTVSRRLGTLTGDAAASAKRDAPRVGLLTQMFQALGPYAFGGGDASIVRTLSAS